MRGNNNDDDGKNNDTPTPPTPTPTSEVPSDYYLELVNGYVLLFDFTASRLGLEKTEQLLIPEIIKFLQGNTLHYIKQALWNFR